METCKALNRQGTRCKSEIFDLGLCKVHYQWYISNHRKFHLADLNNPEILNSHKKKRKKNKQRPTKIQCLGTTQSEERCERLIRPKNKYCFQHKNQDTTPKPISPRNYKKYIDSKAWSRKSKEARDEYDNRCRVCNRSGLIHSHHRTYERLGIEHHNDLTPLCSECHDLFHSHYEYNKESHTFMPKQGL